MRASSLVVTAIKLKDGWAYLHASHSTDDPGESDAQQTPVTAQSVANGKTTDVASATGVATPGKGGWVAVAVGDLPTGQFDLVVHALGLQATVRLETSGGNLKRVTARDRDDLVWAADSVGGSADSDVHVEVK